MHVWLNAFAESQIVGGITLLMSRKAFNLLCINLPRILLKTDKRDIGL